MSKYASAVLPDGALSSVHGAHDMWEHMTYEGQLYKCVSDTSYSPTDQAQAWEAVTE